MRALRGAALGLLVILACEPVTGWAQAPTSGSTADGSIQELKERVLAYWEARVKKDYRREYELLEPRAQARRSPEEYGRGRSVEYLAVQVEKAERRGNFAEVAVRLLVKITHPALPGGARRESAVIQDQWVFVEGVWYRSEEADLGAPLPWPAPSTFSLTRREGVE